MVMKQQIELGHRFPADDEVRWNRLTVSVSKMRLNESLSEGVFRFTAPEDANTLPAGPCGIFSMGGSTGFIQNGPDERRRIEHRSSHEWEGDTLVEKSKWKMRGIVLTFERRLTFLGDESELNIDERIIGPESEASGSFKIRLR